MAKREKKIHDLNLHELILAARMSENALNMYTDPEWIDKTLTNLEIREKLFTARNDLHNQLEELNKRFNAPSNYTRD